MKIIHPYEYLYKKNYNISKTNLFYDFIEIFNLLNIFDVFNNIDINTLCVTSKYSDFLYYFKTYRDNYNDIILYYNEVDDNIIKNINDKKFDFLFFESEFHSINSYVYKLIEFIMVILKNQKKDGITIIKINSIFHKPVVDILYILSSLFQKTYIINPSTCNITNFSKYIVCKNFRVNQLDNSYLKLNYFKLIIFLKRLENKNINKILDFDLPYYFKSKIDDLNIIIGQQQLEALDQIISIYKNKNKNDKIESIKKNNIQKSVSWCEKYKIPCNKFTEKINIFLPIINETI
jgi:hypothetical protein